MDKPFLTFEQQVNKLKKEYNLIIENHNFAIELLSSISYYDLINGYQDIYMENQEFKDNVTIELLFATHIFNKNIQGVLFKYATYAENSFKTILANVLSSNFSENESVYLDISNYKRDRNPNQRERLIETLKVIKKIAKHTSNTPTSYYRNKKNHIPPWILLRNVSFSDSTNLFSFLKNKDKSDVFNYFKHLNNENITFENKVNILLDALTLTRKFRNKIAHNLNFLTYRNVKLDKSANLLFKDTLIARKELDITRNDIWAMVLSIIILLNNDILTHNFLAEFNSFMIADNTMAISYCEFSNIPYDFENRITNYLA